MRATATATARLVETAAGAWEDAKVMGGAWAGWGGRGGGAREGDQRSDGLHDEQHVSRELGYLPLELSNLLTLGGIIHLELSNLLTLGGIIHLKLGVVFLELGVVFLELGVFRLEGINADGEAHREARVGAVCCGDLVPQG